MWDWTAAISNVISSQKVWLHIQYIICIMYFTSKTDPTGVGTVECHSLNLRAIDQAEIKNVLPWNDSPSSLTCFLH